MRSCWTTASHFPPTLSITTSSPPSQTYLTDPPLHFTLTTRDTFLQTAILVGSFSHRFFVFRVANSHSILYVYWGFIFLIQFCWNITHILAYFNIWDTQDIYIKFNLVHPLMRYLVSLVWFLPKRFIQKPSKGLKQNVLHVN